ncbi:hypothetical protein SDC9_211913 [bioreactor metagenome]|uniref:Uncharacterized protein n=1 Tax=bioreactor metagenome TaxID=1076179 RepID=A0A645JLJ9_9ZZZZ
MVMNGLSLLVDLDLSDSSVVPGIGAVHIVCQSPSKDGMIEAGIELGFILITPSTNLYSSEFLFPDGVGIRFYFIKCFGSSFSLIV